MKPHHMNPEDAVQAHKDLHSQHSLGIHHSTFQLTDEAFSEPREKLKKLNLDLDKPFVSLSNGKSIRLF